MPPIYICSHKWVNNPSREIQQFSIFASCHVVGVNNEKNCRSSTTAVVPYIHTNLRSPPPPLSLSPPAAGESEPRSCRAAPPSQVGLSFDSPYFSTRIRRGREGGGGGGSRFEVGISRCSLRLRAAGSKQHGDTRERPNNLRNLRTSPGKKPKVKRQPSTTLHLLHV